ncbi:hypothetical protein MtrunA17_Chr6g0479721 [Medicago truncatula]|uniref:Uncharacterized protein n=1 Tax=Medicago truncatula TaxID=3880 RepID=G7KIG2_MEDTR|nr:hypothetical protein MTR_6g072520 [Medicago truncatula]RHN52367.1 hypothetical protein MtrunA17_Chr6g0479721 [Medicago truncatula]
MENNDNDFTDFCSTYYGSTDVNLNDDKTYPNFVGSQGKGNENVEHNVDDDSPKDECADDESDDDDDDSAGDYIAGDEDEDDEIAGDDSAGDESADDVNEGDHHQHYNHQHHHHHQFGSTVSVKVNDFYFWYG